MLEKLREIDTSAIKELVRIKNEQEELRNFLGKAEEFKEKVDPVVFRRVREDYDNRHGALEKQAVPLKAQARKEYQKLRVLYEQLTRAHEDARIDKEELEFRHSVGELGDEELTLRLRQAEQILEQRRMELEEADKLKERFAEAFRSREELEAEPALPEVEPARSQASEPAAKAVSEPAPVAAGGRSAEPAVAAPAATDSEATQIVERDILPKPAPGPDESEEKTFVIPEAKLVVEGTGTEYRLGACMYIGRGDENQIQLNAAGVSRKHASVMFGRDGFAIKDEHSRYGTFVNDQPVTERILADGDQIRIGEVELVFRCR